MGITVSFKNVVKKYKMYNKNIDKIIDIVKPGGYGKDFYALQNITFEAYEGDVIGVLGVNGAGKSTLSNLITGVIPPTTGSVDLKGKASLIAIASGLNNQLTGKENIELKCLMLGFSKSEIRNLIPEVIEFADIGDFIDQPVKNYSSGMRSRLGFAISVTIDPDVLVIDEALSVGDQEFAEKCLAKMNEFKKRGKTIFFISHSLRQMKKFCDKALWLEAGEIKEYGEIETVLPRYIEFVNEYKALSKEEQISFKKEILNRRSKLNDKNNLKRFESSRKRKLFNVPFTFFSIALIFCLSIIGYYIVIQNNESSIDTILQEEVLLSDSSREKNGESPIKVIPINKAGIISTDLGNSYFDQELAFPITEIPFGTSIFIEEQIGESYKISFENKTSYISVDDVQIVDKSNTVNEEISIDRFLPILPEEFTSSYEYFLAFIGSDLNEIEEVFVGGSRELVNSSRRYALYNYGLVSFGIGTDNIADSIIINDVNPTTFKAQGLDSYAIIDIGDSMYYFNIEGYDGVLNLKEETLELSVKEE